MNALKVEEAIVLSKYRCQVFPFVIVDMLGSRKVKWKDHWLHMSIEHCVEKKARENFMYLILVAYK